MTDVYLPRSISGFIASASRQFPVLMLTGPRQVGKTTLLEALCAPPEATRANVHVPPAAM